jgi:hypothetical protein
MLGIEGVVMIKNLSKISDFLCEERRMCSLKNEDLLVILGVQSKL